MSSTATPNDVLALQEELRTTRALLDGLGARLPCAVMVLKLAPSNVATPQYISEAVREVYELTPDDLRRDVGRMVERIHPDDLAAVRESGRAERPDGQVHRVEFRVQLPTRGVRWIASQRTTWLQPDGSRLLYSAHIDITERKQIEDRLRERDALLRSLGRHVPGMIFKRQSGSTDRRLTDYVSDGVRQVLEIEPDDWLASPNIGLANIHPDDAARVRAAYAGWSKRPGHHSLEYRVVLPRQGLRWLSVQGSIETGADGESVVYGHVADITEHKLYAEARSAAASAEQANRAKSEFLSRMSHELRTPLNAVLGFSQLLRLDTSQPLSPQQREKVDLIESAGAHLLAVIGDVLDLSRIESGSMTVSLEPLQLATLVADAQALVSSLAAQHGVTLPTAQLPAGVRVIADRVRLRQVLVNLLSNAIKYNRADGRVEVRSWCEGDTVAIEVADTGMGMTPQQLDHLFEPFNRLGAERGNREGTGIGLVIVNRLVELMNGRLTVDSTPGTGSRFCVWLPLARPATAPASALPAGAAPHTAMARDAHLLYVEDNEVNIDLVRQILTMRPSWRLDVAHSGNEALAAVRQNRPELILMDMHLGDMNGCELARRLDCDPATAGVPRIALSADAMSEQVKAARAHGFIGYLTKPIDVAVLLGCLDEQLQ
jgi:signal transduction histidine kinase